jgi:AcrR family transcriptional regulator
MSPRTEDAYQALRDERSEQILDAALKVFATKGFEAAKITDIAESAGVSYGLVAHYFGKKEEIYAAVVAHAYDCALVMLEKALVMPGTPWERLTFVCSELLTRIRSFPETLDYLVLLNQVKTLKAIPAGALARVRSIEKKYLDIQVKLVKAGQESGEVVDGDPAELVIIFTSVIQGLSDRWTDEEERKRLQKHFPSADTVLRLLKA